MRTCVGESLSFRIWAVTTASFDNAVCAVRRGIKEDKVIFLDSLTVQADQAAERGDNWAIYQLAKRAAGVRSRLMKDVEWVDGSLTSSLAQYTQRFQDHFAGVFGTKIVQRR